MSIVDAFSELQIAIKNNNYQSAAQALSRGANVNCGDNGWPILYDAIDTGNPAIVGLLIRHNADVNAYYLPISSYRKTPLCQTTNKVIIKMLLDAGADSSKALKFLKSQEQECLTAERIAEEENEEYGGMLSMLSRVSIVHDPKSPEIARTTLNKYQARINAINEVLAELEQIKK